MCMAQGRLRASHADTSRALWLQAAGRADIARAMPTRPASSETVRDVISIEAAPRTQRIRLLLDGRAAGKEMPGASRSTEAARDHALHLARTAIAAHLTAEPPIEMENQEASSVSDSGGHEMCVMVCGCAVGLTRRTCACGSAASHCRGARREAGRLPRTPCPRLTKQAHTRSADASAAARAGR